MDKMSYFEIADDYVMDCGSYKTKDFLMYYLNTKFEEGLVQLKDDKDVNEMLKKHSNVLDVYTTAAQMSTLEAQLEAQPSMVATHISPTKTTNSSQNEIIVSETQQPFSLYDSFEESGLGSDTNEDETHEKDEINYSDIDDDGELKTSQTALLIYGKELELLKKNLVENFLIGSSEHVVETHNTNVDETYSSYEESDGDVNSPGESEEDDIRGKKYKVIVPVVDEVTDWSKWEWVVRNKVCYKCCFQRGYLQEEHGKNIQLTADFIADEMLSIFKARPHWPAKKIQGVKEKYKVIIGKWMAYKAKSYAHKKLHGSMKDHYSNMGSYLKALKDANPNSTFSL
ncbi:hypothetical protein QVD17_35269 [Tagetes erecta]|uniref:Uncharacterized protein n=1 Tax=Tagetes erecta TaxID=13708 RepID=A0AAD8JZ35_TARER|nr:hypothetical protein QVD17_35269 [Tagetes erecta]